MKTYNGALGVDVNGKDQPTLLEIAKAAGKATGNVSTAELQDATPAALVSHVTSRKCYGPEETSEKCAANALENGGRGSITEQLLKPAPTSRWAAARSPSTNWRKAANGKENR